MDLIERVDADFDRARRWASFASAGLAVVGSLVVVFVIREKEEA